MRRSFLTLFACLLPLVPSAVQGRHATRQPGSAVLLRLAQQPIPARNLYQLTDELKLSHPTSIPRVVRHTSPNYSVGHQDTFWVLGEDANTYFKMRATILAEAPHIYIYVQNGEHVSRADAEAAAQTFEHSIYPTDRRYFGSEWRPGVDGDPHVTCLVGDLRSSGAAGFYSAEDEYPRIVNPYSNEREMFYINGSSLQPGTSEFNLVIAHEFQHMIHWNMHPHDNAWLNEGMSMLAEWLNRYPPQDEPNTFVQLPTTQLNAWSLSGDSSFAHYGAAYLFLAYLYDRYGSAFVRNALADGRFTDFELINDALRRTHVQSSARQLFTQWVAANALDRSAPGGVYSYVQLPRTASIAYKKALPFTVKAAIPPWAAQYVRVKLPTGGAPFDLHFSGAPTVPLVGVARNGFWWSNRGDMSDTSMERSFDLRKVHTATLHFQTWYDIEKDYDYAYVEASLDGKTWHTLRGTDTVTTNPYDANYGNGYTGASKTWRTESVDLSAYAGHIVHLKLEYVTDDEYNGQGMAVQGLQIPQIGYRDDLSGWTTHGWIPVASNALPNDWALELIEKTSHGYAVVPYRHATGGLSIRIDARALGLKSLTVAIFTTAPKTTNLSTYTLSAR